MANLNMMPIEKTYKNKLLESFIRNFTTIQ